ncbi:glycosyltransferase family 4 protein [Arthrobacter sp. NtRootA1]|uniref:glycosyltransferase family 4 protein n=1 Tax=Arthrobacter sp. NtRootA1 TaxID=2830983 RepID=UPI001CC48EB7|nr:glycosyltransferase family 4 protein [Arthrobacter sp. NtRootA1]
MMVRTDEAFRVGAPRILLVKTRGRSTVERADRQRLESSGAEPRSLLFEETLNCDVLDENTIQHTEGLRAHIYKRLPAFAAQAFEAARLSGSYDVIITWSERHSVAVAALFAVLRIRTPHLAMMFWLSKPAVRWPLRVVRTGIDRIVTWSSIQRTVAIEQIGFRPDDVVLVRHPVDLEFFKPVDSEREIIFSAGSTQRDFPTFADAVRGLDAPVHIAASLVVALDGYKIITRDVRDEPGWPENCQVRPLTSVELRDAYAAAKVVVVPLLPTDIDAGVNVILEGMAMGRPVIVSETQGQVDVIRDGDTGVFVPTKDSPALRSRIESFLADPEAAEEMGRRGRAYVEQNHRLEDFIDHVRSNVLELSARPSRRSFWSRRSGVTLGSVRN